MDLCGIWNAKLPQMQAIGRAYDFADEIDDEERRWKLIDAADVAWEALVQTIGDEMASYAKQTMRAEQDYYTSHEFWDDWLDDGETWFTREGEAA